MCGDTPCSCSASPLSTREQQAFVQHKVFFLAVESTHCAAGVILLQARVCRQLKSQSRSAPTNRSASQSASVLRSMSAGFDFRRPWRVLQLGLLVLVSSSVAPAVAAPAWPSLSSSNPGQSDAAKPGESWHDECCFSSVPCMLCTKCWLLGMP